MPALGIDHYNLHAPRELLDQLRDFYRDIVGLEPGPRPSLRTAGYWMYAEGHAVVHLSETMPDEICATHVATTFNHVAFACTDLAAMQDILARAALAYRRVDVPARGVVQLFLSDPAGNGVELSFG